jgi:3-hydroxyisobutyrate dehydrogenase-like beta-hydroxyacid dehydrogenase
MKVGFVGLGSMGSGMVGQACELWHEAVDRYGGDGGHLAVVRLVEEQAGVSVRSGG